MAFLEPLALCLAPLRTNLKLKTEKKALKNIKGTTGVFSFEEAYDISKELLAKKKEK